MLTLTTSLMVTLAAIFSTECKHLVSMFTVIQSVAMASTTHTEISAEKMVSLALFDVTTQAN